MVKSTRTTQTPPQTNCNGKNEFVSGLVYCPDCGAKLHFAAAKSMTRNQEHFRCSNYKSGRGDCTVHYIRDVVFEEIVKEAISRLADFVKCHEATFLYMLAKKNSAMQRVEYQRLKQSVEKDEKRITNLDRLIENLYEEKVLEGMTEERYSKMMLKYEKEQKELIAAVEENKAILQQTDRKLLTYGFYFVRCESMRI